MDDREERKPRPIPGIQAFWTWLASHCHVLEPLCSPLEWQAILATRDAPSIEQAARSCGQTERDYRNLLQRPGGKFFQPATGEGALVPVEAGRALHALIQFDQKPDRESFGRLAGDLQWARSLGGYSLEEDLPPIASVVADRDPDNPGGSLVCGTFRREAVLGRELAGQGGELLVVRASGGTDAFVAKYDREGRILWARVFGGAGIDQARGVAVDGEGRVFVTGAFSERAGLRVAGGSGMQNTSWSLESSGQRDLFVPVFRPRASASGCRGWVVLGTTRPRG